MEDRLIKLDSTYNFRDMGGYNTVDNKRVKRRKLFRSDSLSKLTSNDVKTLENLNITTIIDYRSDLERKDNEDVPVPGATVYVLDPIAEIAMFAGSGKGDVKFEEITQEMAAKFLQEQNIDFVESDHSRKVYSELIRKTIESEGGLVNHCSAGKDRTGYGSALILLLLGVSKEDVIKDYLQTNENLKNKPKGVSSLDSKNPEMEKALKYFEGVDRSYLEPALDLIDHKYDGVENYAINELQITPNEIETLRNKYLEWEKYEGK